MLFDCSSPPPFFQAQLTDAKRQQLDQLFIGKRSQSHYLKRFASFDQAQRIGPRWHWASFFMTLAWMLYRRRFLDGLVYAVVGWSFLHLAITLVLVIIESTLMLWIPAEWHWHLRFGMAGSIILTWYCLTAMWTDAYYYRVARREISETIEDRLSPEQQATHLQQEGGTSLEGLFLALSLFVFAMLTIQHVFLPMYATYQQRNLLYAVYELADHARQRVDVITHSQGCPIGLPLTTEHQAHDLATLVVLDRAQGIPQNSTCVIEATIHGARWPIANLNGERLTLYYLPEHQRWRCTTSISQRESPKGCLPD